MRYVIGAEFGMSCRKRDGRRTPSWRRISTYRASSATDARDHARQSSTATRLHRCTLMKRWWLPDVGAPGPVATPRVPSVVPNLRQPGLARDRGNKGDRPMSLPSIPSSHRTADVRRSPRRTWWRTVVGAAAAVFLAVSGTTLAGGPANATAPADAAAVHADAVHADATSAQCLTVKVQSSFWQDGPDSGGVFRDIAITNSCTTAVTGWKLVFVLPPARPSSRAGTPPGPSTARSSPLPRRHGTAPSPADNRSRSATSAPGPATDRSRTAPSTGKHATGQTQGLIRGRLPGRRQGRYRRLR